MAGSCKTAISGHSCIRDTLDGSALCKRAGTPSAFASFKLYRVPLPECRPALSVCSWLPLEVSFGMFARKHIIVPAAQLIDALEWYEAHDVSSTD